MTDTTTIPRGLTPGMLFIVGRQDYDRSVIGELLSPGDVFVVVDNLKHDRIDALPISWEVADQLAPVALRDALRRKA